MSEVNGKNTFDGTSYSLKWTGHYFNDTIFSTFFDVLKSKTLYECEQHFSIYTGPAFSMAMIDSSGNIAYMYLGKYPIRTAHTLGGRVKKGYISEH